MLEEKKETLDVLENGFVKTAQKKKKKNPKQKRISILNRFLQPVCSSMKGSPGPPGQKGQEGAPGPKVIFLEPSGKKTGKHARFSLALFLILLFSRESEGWKETSELLA